MEIMLPTGDVVNLEIELDASVSESTGPKTLIYSVTDKGCVAYLLTKQQQAIIAPYLNWVLRTVRYEAKASMTCIVVLEPWYIENGSYATVNHAIFEEIIPDRRKYFMDLIEWMEFVSRYSHPRRVTGRLQDVMVLDGKTTTLRRMTTIDHLWMWWMKGKVVYDKLD